MIIVLIIVVLVLTIVVRMVVIKIIANLLRGLGFGFRVWLLFSNYGSSRRRQQGEQFHFVGRVPHGFLGPSFEKCHFER